jgi:serine/threonine-protein kinase
MDYIDGTDTAQLIQKRYPAGMPAELAIPIITAVASALDYAHKRGLLHRDVKPANIIHADLDSDDRQIFLADFGIARSP